MEHGIKCILFPQAAEVSLTPFFVFPLCTQMNGISRGTRDMKYHYDGAGTVLYLSDTICWPASSSVYCVTTSAQ